MQLRHVLAKALPAQLSDAKAALGKAAKAVTDDSDDGGGGGGGSCRWLGVAVRERISHAHAVVDMAAQNARRWYETLPKNEDRPDVVLQVCLVCGGVEK